MSFTWIPIYSEIAHKVLEFENRQGELLSLLGEMRSEGMKVILLNDRNAEGKVVPLAEIDPFTFFASFNRTSSVSGRQVILAKIKTAWNLSSPVPDDFDGIPTTKLQAPAVAIRGVQESVGGGVVGELQIGGIPGEALVGQAHREDAEQDGLGEGTAVFER